MYHFKWPPLQSTSLFEFLFHCICCKSIKVQSLWHSTVRWIILVNRRRRCFNSFTTIGEPPLRFPDSDIILYGAVHTSFHKIPSQSVGLHWTHPHRCILFFSISASHSPPVSTTLLVRCSIYEWPPLQRKRLVLIESIICPHHGN